MNSETHEANRRAAWRWGAFVVGMLGLQVAGGVMAIMLATGDQSVAVVPDYHQKALRWDEEVALRQASRSLGWTCEVDYRTAGGSRPATLQFALTDRGGVPVKIASGELKIYRHARAADVRVVPIPRDSIAVIELADCFDEAGLWQVSVDMQDHAGNRFVDSRELDVRLGASRIADSSRSPEFIGAAASLPGVVPAAAHQGTN